MRAPRPPFRAGAHVPQNRWLRFLFRPDLWVPNSASRRDFRRGAAPVAHRASKYGRNTSSHVRNATTIFIRAPLYAPCGTISPLEAPARDAHARGDDSVSSYHRFRTHAHGHLPTLWFRLFRRRVLRVPHAADARHGHFDLLAKRAFPLPKAQLRGRILMTKTGSRRCSRVTFH